MNTIEKFSRNALLECIHKSDCSVNSIRHVYRAFPLLQVVKEEEFGDYDTFLFFAILNKKSVNVIKELLEQGGGIHMKSNLGDTALHYAMRYISEEQYDIVATLIERGVDVNAKNLLGQTPFCILVNNLQNRNLFPLVKVMYSYVNSHTIHLALIKVILQTLNYCYLGLRNHNCSTIHANAFKVVKFLLESGVELDLTKIQLGTFVDKISKFDNVCRQRCTNLIELILKHMLSIDGGASFLEDVIEIFSFNIYTWDEYIREILFMKTDYIDLEYSLLDFVWDSHKNRSSLSNYRSSLRNSLQNNFEVVKRIFSKKYPIAEYLLYNSLRVYDLYDLQNSLLLKRINLSCDTTVLNPTCFYLVAKYLTKEDLINFIISIYNKYLC